MGGTKDSSDRRLIEQLERRIAGLERQINALGREPRVQERRQTYLAITTCGEDDDPAYPEPPSDTFRIAFLDAAFEPDPGQQKVTYKLRQAPTTKYGAVARNIAKPSWVPEGTPILATWQRCFGGDIGEWWFDRVGLTGRLKAILSKPLEFADEWAYFRPNTVFDLQTGMPVNLTRARNDVLYWNALNGDEVLVAWDQDREQFFIDQPRNHSACMVHRIDDDFGGITPPGSDSGGTGGTGGDGDCNTNPGALTQTQVMINVNFARVPKLQCEVAPYFDCITEPPICDYEPAPAEFVYDRYAFESSLGKRACCEEDEKGSGSEHEGSEFSGGSCQTGEGMTGELD